MKWMTLTLISAFSLATVDALTKKDLSHLTPYEMGLTRVIYAFPWIVLALFWIPWVTPDRIFCASVAVGLPLEILAFYCYMKALRTSPLSLTLPLLAFTLVFIILSGRLILGETVGVGGFMGILLVVMGAYLLNFSHW